MGRIYKERILKAYDPYNKLCFPTRITNINSRLIFDNSRLRNEHSIRIKSTKRSIISTPQESLKQLAKVIPEKSSNDTYLKNDKVDSTSNKIALPELQIEEKKEISAVEIPIHPFMDKREEYISSIAEFFENRGYLLYFHKIDQMISTFTQFQNENKCIKHYNEYFYTLKFRDPLIELISMGREAEKEIRERLSQVFLLPTFSFMDIKLEKNFQEIIFTISSFYKDYTLEIDNINQIPVKFLCISQLEIKPIFSDKAKILNYLDPRYDHDYSNQKDCIDQSRGNLPYVTPVGWTGLALKVNEKDRNKEILSNNNNQDEWAVGFHGTKIQHIPSIILNGLYPGPGQVYCGDIDKNDRSDNKGKICGRGVYFCKNIVGCTGYCGKFALNSRKRFSTIVAFQCRLNPSKIRIPTTPPDIMIVNQTQDILPYRIMIKIL